MQKTTIMFAKFFVLALLFVVAFGKHSSRSSKHSSKDEPYGVSYWNLKSTPYGYVCGEEGTSGPPSCHGNSFKKLTKIKTYDHQPESKSLAACCGVCGTDFPECECYMYDGDASTCTMYSKIDAHNPTMSPNTGKGTKAPVHAPTAPPKH